MFCFATFANKEADSLRALIDKTDNDTLKVNCWNRISMINSNEGRFSLAEKAGFEALDLANRSDFKRGIGDACYQIGIAFSKQAKYDVAMEWYLKARTQYEKINNKSGLGFTYLLIGVIDYYLHNNEKAEENYKKAVKYFEEANDKAGKANVTVNLAYLYMEAKKYEEAINEAEKAYTLFKQGNSYHGMAVCKTCVAGCYIDLFNKNDTIGNKDLADEYLNRTAKAYSENVSIYKWLKMPTEISNEYTNLFEIYFSAARFNKELAKSYLDSALANVDVKRDARHAMVVFGDYYKWYLSKGDSLKAFNYYLKYSASKDSVFNAEKAEKLEGLSVQLAELEKQKEIDDLTSDKEKRGLVLWGVGALAVLALAFSVLFFKRFRDKQTANHILSDKNKIIEQKNKEITDSIRYAKRIQTTLLPSEKYLEKTINKLKGDS